jgi:hypothetical protein
MRKLDEIVREFYIERLHASQTDNRFPMFIQIAISGLRDLNMDAKSIIKEVELTVNANDTVNLPNDYIDYLVIGVVDSGIISALGANNNLAPRSYDSCGNLNGAPGYNGDENTFFSYNSSHFTKDGQFNGRAYGAGGGGSANGTYKVYKNDGYIALSGASASTIVMRYLANLSQVDGSFMVDEYYVEALKDWMYWKYVQNQRSYGLGDKQLAQATYFREKKKAMKRQYRFSIIEFVEAYQSGYRSAPGI